MGRRVATAGPPRLPARRGEGPAPPPPLTIAQALDDPEIFGPVFQPTSSWQAWRAFLGALFGLPLSAEQLACYQRHTGRTEAPAGPVREA